MLSTFLLATVLTAAPAQYGGYHGGYHGGGYSSNYGYGGYRWYDAGIYGGRHFPAGYYTQIGGSWYRQGYGYEYGAPCYPPPCPPPTQVVVPVAQAQVAPCYISFYCPVGSQLWVNGVIVRSTGLFRTYASTPYALGYNQTFNVRCAYQFAGGSFNYAFQVPAIAGQTSVVQVDPNAQQPVQVVNPNGQPVQVQVQQQNGSPPTIPQAVPGVVPNGQPVPPG